MDTRVEVIERRRSISSEESSIDTAFTSDSAASLTQSEFLPPGAFDTHLHVFDPRLGPYSPDRSYTPANATLSQLLAFNKQISSRHSNLVIVQPSPYRNDNKILLEILAQLRSEDLPAKAIAVFDCETITDEELLAMQRSGVCGLRLNLQADGHAIDVNALRSKLVTAAARIRSLPGWMLQIFCSGQVWEALFETFSNIGVTIIADHTGGMLAPSKLTSEWKDQPTKQPGFDALIRLAKSSKVKIKVSGLYRSSTDTVHNFADMEPIIRALAREVPDSLIWGSDWPHTGEGKDRLQSKNINVIEPFREIDNLAILRNLRSWMDDDTWRKMMVSNPEGLFR